MFDITTPMPVKADGVTGIRKTPPSEIVLEGPRSPGQELRRHRTICVGVGVGFGRRRQLNHVRHCGACSRERLIEERVGGCAQRAAYLGSAEKDLVPVDATLLHISHRTY
ncbi:hypothetical protein [Tardiphaga sp. 862_B3_N1_1]|uniref:hypothetical protein n=1 Tax=Tardiphaga sp. 862_B3_N1_1 TaxID=3240763 RepID=UPI003F8C195C